MIMYILITYDVSTETREGRKRLRQVAKTCENIGQRVQNSVFECEISLADFTKVKAKLLKIINKEQDNLRIYYMGNHWQKKIEHFGIDKSFDIQGPLIV